MDSCQLFNFIFGSKSQASSELSKCFTSSLNKKKNNNNRKSDAASASQSSTTSTQSPFKKIQNKIQSLSARTKQKASIATTVATSNHDTTNSTTNDNNDANNDNNNADKDFVYKAYLIDSDKLDDVIVQTVNDEQFDMAADDVTMIEIGGRTHNERKPHKFDWSLQQQQLEEVAAGGNGNGNGNNNINGEACNSPHADSVIKQDGARRKIPHLIMYDNEALNESSSDKKIASATVYDLVEERKAGYVYNRKLRLTSSTEDDNYVNDDIVDGNDNESTKGDNSCDNQTFGVDSEVGIEVGQIGGQSSDQQQQARRKNSVKDMIKCIESGRKPSIDLEKLKFDNNSETISKETSNFGKNSLTKENEGIAVSSPFKQAKKPITLVKPLPPKTPPKTNKAKFIRIQLSLNKPLKLEQLFQDEIFLKNFFQYLIPLERCVAAQVCKSWRNVLYSDKSYWSGLVNVIDCTQLRREHLIECIRNTLNSSRVRQHLICTDKDNINSMDTGDLSSNQIDLNELWRIQEICTKMAFKGYNYYVNGSTKGVPNQQPAIEQQQQNSNSMVHEPLTASKSSSIPSQISSTISSVSLSSMLSPLSESSRIDVLKEKIYNSLEGRGFDAICLFGATDDDIEDLLMKLPSKSFDRIRLAKLNNCFISNQALGMFVCKFNKLQVFELSGCNALTDSISLRPLVNLRKLIINDCINIGDKFATELISIIDRLDELFLQSYHVTDVFMEAISINADVSRLTVLDLQNCKEITNQTLVTVAKSFTNLRSLSVSGLTRIDDEGIEILAERSKLITKLDLSWCPRLTDLSLECMACELNDSLREIILDRNSNFSNVGIQALASMENLTLIHMRWCTDITDQALEAIIQNKNIKYVSIAGCNQITARSLLRLLESNIQEIELTNVPSATNEFVSYLKSVKPNCTIIF